MNVLGISADDGLRKGISEPLNLVSFLVECRNVQLNVLLDV